MREIKFRAWHPDQGMTMTPVLSTSSYTGKVVCTGYDKDLHEITLPLMQYTGLKDKNGVEIYESDIVNVWGHNLEVKYIVDGFFAESNCGVICEAGQEWEGKCTVIGNTHQNPELLD